VHGQEEEEEEKLFCLVLCFHLVLLVAWIFVSVFGSTCSMFLFFSRSPRSSVCWGIYVIVLYYKITNKIWL